MSFHVELPGSTVAERRAADRSHGRSGVRPLVVALVNNMPDSAVEGTETQFASLLRAAAGTRDVRLRLTTLPEVARGEAVASRVAERYWPIEAIYATPPDALIVTGTEPRAPQLPEEPYWGRFVELMEFAESDVRASAWSCLAAHAAVLRFDGIERRRLPLKRCGVYLHEVAVGDPLLRGVSAALPTPHSRWNDLPADAIEDAGYRILSRSEITGADAFVRDGRAPMLFFQGHPEYEDRTLLKEYQRDVGRFVSGQQDRYPTMPVGYFDDQATQMLRDFEAEVTAGTLREPMTAFPFTKVAATLTNTWSGHAARIYSNWLDQVEALVAETPRRAKIASGSPES